MYTVKNFKNKEEFRLFFPQLFILKNFKPMEYRYAGQGSSQLLMLNHKISRSFLAVKVKGENSQLYNSHRL